MKQLVIRYVAKMIVRMIAILSDSLSHLLGFSPSAFAHQRHIVSRCFILSYFISCDVFVEVVIALKPTSFLVVSILVFKANGETIVRKLLSIATEYKFTFPLDTCGGLRILFLAWCLCGGSRNRPSARFR